jgi:hypothetical protein
MNLSQLKNYYRRSKMSLGMEGQRTPVAMTDLGLSFTVVFVGGNKGD